MLVGDNIYEHRLDTRALSRIWLFAALMLFTMFLFSGCNAPESEASTLLDYTVLDEIQDESPGKALVSMDILVSEYATDAELTDLLLHMHGELTRRSGFQYHDHPTVIAIYAYPTREHAESGMGQWVAMVTTGPTHPEPDVAIKSYRDTSREEDVRFDLSEQQRKDVFKAIVRAEDRGQREAESEIPDDFQRQYDRSDELAEEYKLALGLEFGLTLEELAEISREGLEKNWPFPAM